MDEGSTQLRHSSLVERIGRLARWLFLQALAWIVPVAIMYATCKTLVTYEVEHPWLTRLVGAAMWIPCYFLGGWLEKNWALKPRSNERRKNMEWDDISWFDSIVLFVVVLFAALANNAGSAVMDNFSAITILTYIATLGFGAYQCYKYKKNGVSLWLSVPFTTLSKLAYSTILLLVLRDVALVATGGFIINLIGVLLSMPIALFVLGVCKFPNILATASGGEPILLVVDGLGTLGLVYLFCRYFEFSLSFLF